MSTIRLREGVENKTGRNSGRNIPVKINRSAEKDRVRIVLSAGSAAGSVANYAEKAGQGPGHADWALSLLTENI